MEEVKFEYGDKGSKNQATKVYLAGGFHSGWQDRFIKAFPDLTAIDPRVHGLDNVEQYTQWDLEAIMESRIVFAYLEKTNPGGYALALEIGFAKALGKRIILVDEKSSEGQEHRHALGMVRASADVVFDSLDEGLDFMGKLRGGD